MGRGGGAVHFRSDIRKVGGQFGSGPIRKVERGGGGGGAICFSSYTKKCGGGGGGAIRFRSNTKSGGADTFVWHKENTLLLIINGYNFDQGGAQALHTRARINVIVFFLNFIHSLIVFILETEGGARAPRH